MSSIVGSIDREVLFKPAPGQAGSAGLGMLRLPISARLLIHDGLHRRAAIEAALRLKPELGDETISLVLYVDPGFRRSEQIFSDLKRHESRSPRSQGILCDSRDELALITKEVVKRVDVFDGMTEMVRSKISNRSTQALHLERHLPRDENTAVTKAGDSLSPRSLPRRRNSGRRSRAIFRIGAAPRGARSARRSYARLASTLMQSPSRHWPARGDRFSRSSDQRGARDWRRSGNSIGPGPTNAFGKGGP